MLKSINICPNPSDSISFYGMNNPFLLWDVLCYCAVPPLLFSIIRSSQLWNTAPSEFNAKNIHSADSVFFLSMKYLLYVSLHPVGRCLFYAVRAVGVKDGGRTYECLALYADMRGLGSPLGLPFRWRRKKHWACLSIAYKNLFLAPNSRQPFIIFKLKWALCAHLCSEELRIKR